MRIYLDTSALAKRYIEEPGSKELEDLFLSFVKEVYVSVLALPEFAAAISRKARNKNIPHKSITKAMKELETDWHGLFNKIPLAEELAMEAASLSIQHPVKGADAVHLATAVASKPTLFVASDKNLLKSAEKIGLNPYNPSSGYFRP